MDKQTTFSQKIINFLIEIIIYYVFGFLISLALWLLVNFIIKLFEGNFHIPFWWNCISAAFIGIYFFKQPEMTKEMVEEKKRKEEDYIRSKYPDIISAEVQYGLIFTRAKYDPRIIYLTEAGIHLPGKYYDMNYSTSFYPVIIHLKKVLPDFIAWENIKKCYLYKAVDYEPGDAYYNYETILLILHNNEKINLQVEYYQDWKTLRNSICKRLIDKFYISEHNFVSDKYSIPYIDNSNLILQGNLQKAEVQIEERIEQQKQTDYEKIMQYEEKRKQEETALREKYQFIDYVLPIYNVAYINVKNKSNSITISCDGIHFSGKFSSITHTGDKNVMPDFIPWNLIDSCYLGKMFPEEAPLANYDLIYLLFNDGNKFEFQLEKYNNWENLRNSVCFHLINKLYLMKLNTINFEMHSIPYKHKQKIS